MMKDDAHTAKVSGELINFSLNRVRLQRSLYEHGIKHAVSQGRERLLRGLNHIVLKVICLKSSVNT